jgi:KDO2-lipid IV(A) lauroyltransferase
MPGQWQYSLLRLMSRIVCLLPYKTVLALGALLGRLYYRLAGRQRRRALAQIQESLNISAGQAEDIVKNLCLNLGRTFLEVMYMPALTPENITQYITIENKHYLTNAVAEGHGVVLLTAHIGNWEWLGAALAMAGFPLTSVIKRQPNDQHTRILNEYRQMVGIEIFARGTAELVGAAKALRKGKILGFVADQDAGGSGVFINFLGKMASTPLGPAVFAKKFKCPVIPAFIVRKPEGGHRVLIYPPLYYRNTDDEAEALYNLTLDMTRITEDTIRQYPDQWLWFQKRWHTPFKAGSSVFGGPTAQRHERTGEQA